MSDEIQDHYAVLNVSIGATVQQIKSAARKLYVRHHPDKGGKAEDFRKVVIKHA
jgi:curved DNA-binding protein CbpA